MEQIAGGRVGGSAIRSVQIVRVIRVHSVYGEGVDGDPIREIVEWYDMDGKLIRRQDAFAGGDGT
jgi:hypothetical protein